MEDKIIAQTKEWIQSVVIGCNFCPFAAKAVLRDSIRYVVVNEPDLELNLHTFMDEIHFLDASETIETTFIIFADHYADFEEYLHLVSLAEDLAAEHEYDGVYQIASFHPEYCFADAKADDPANFTNRSIFPMIHLLREDSITAAIEHYPDAEGIPDRNIAFSREKGLQYMKQLRAACLAV